MHNKQEIILQKMAKVVSGQVEKILRSLVTGEFDVLKGFSGFRWAF